MSMKKTFGRTPIVMAWLMIGWGTLAIGFMAPIAYLLATHQVHPGEPYFVDGLAPIVQEAVLFLLLATGVLVSGFVLKHFVKKLLLITSHSRGDGVPPRPWFQRWA